MIFDVDDPVAVQRAVAVEREGLLRKMAGATPRESPGTLWSMQSLLLLEAQRLLGPRDRTKMIYQPQLDARSAPVLMHDSRGIGAFATLTKGAGERWDTCIFELAHETVHLLDQPRAATVLEEGAAVIFSLYACKLLRAERFRGKATRLGDHDRRVGYARAAALVERIPGGVRALRVMAGGFSRINLSHLRAAGVSDDKARALLAPFAAAAAADPIAATLATSYAP
jgi:hypothetical protein